MAVIVRDGGRASSIIRIAQLCIFSFEMATRRSSHRNGARALAMVEFVVEDLRER